MKLDAVSHWAAYNMQSIHKKSEGKVQFSSEIMLLLSDMQRQTQRHNENVICACFNRVPDLWRSYQLYMPISPSVQCVCGSNKFITSLQFFCFQKIK